MSDPYLVLVGTCRSLGGNKFPYEWRSKQHCSETDIVPYIHLVERDRGTKEAVDHVRIVVQLLVNHQSKDTHLGSTAVVKLDGQLLLDSLCIPARCLQLGSLNLLLANTESVFRKSNEKEKLSNAPAWNSIESSKTSLHRGEWNSVGNVTRKTDTCSGDNMTKDCKHSNAAVLDLDRAKTIKALLVSISQKT